MTASVLWCQANSRSLHPAAPARRVLTSDCVCGGGGQANYFCGCTRFNFTKRSGTLIEDMFTTTCPMTGILPGTLLVARTDEAIAGLCHHARLQCAS